jgi:ATP-dependent DNA ligase
MPLFRRNAEPTVSEDPSTWRPQKFGRGAFRSIMDPVIEPAWGGVRVFIRVATSERGRSVTLIDEDGEDATEEFADIVGAIGESALAEDMILDGYLTVEPTQNTIGVDTIEVEAPNRSAVMSQMIMGQRKNRSGRPPRKLDPNKPIAFVAVDLLRVDGQNLVGLPLLERKRLLEGTLKVDELVRITPYVRPPLGSLAFTWRALGFRELVYKPANSRYWPGGDRTDWILVMNNPR